jgi:MFS family permease
MASISTKDYQFLLSQALCSSIGASMVFYPTFSATVTWFFKKRAMAVGIAAAGSSLGGVIFPIMVSRLVVEVGFGWTMRTCAFLILGLLIVANLFIKSRIPPYPRPVKLMDFITPLTEPTFTLLTTVWVLFLPLSNILADGILGFLPLFYGTFHTLHLHHSRSHRKRNGCKLSRISGLNSERGKCLRTYTSRLFCGPLHWPLQHLDCNGVKLRNGWKLV